MATKNIVPRATGEGNIGRTDKHWLGGYFDNIVDLGELNLNAATELTISGGAITATQTFHIVDTEANGASDDLVTINGGDPGTVLILRSADSTRDVTIKASGGNIVTPSGLDFVLNSVNIVVILVKDAGDIWKLVSSSGSAIGTGSNTFAGSGGEKTIAHGLGSSPSAVSVTPTANPSGNLGEVWCRKDATNIYVGNSGSAVTAFDWIAIK
jgi:hypothetical protein